MSNVRVVYGMGVWFRDVAGFADDATRFRGCALGADERGRRTGRDGNCVIISQPSPRHHLSPLPTRRRRASVA